MSYPTELEDLLDAGTVAIRGMLRVTFGSGTYGLWSGTGDYEYAGVTYRANSVISIEDIPSSMGSDAVTLRIEIPESADFGITPDMLASIEDEDYKGRPIVISDAFFNPDTRELVHVEPLYSGFIDTIEHIRSGGEVRMVVNVETTALDNHRDGFRSASNADQQLVSEGDKFFEHAALTPFETFKVTFPQ